MSWAQREGWGVCYLKEKLKAGIRDEGIIGKFAIARPVHVIDLVAYKVCAGVVIA